MSSGAWKSAKNINQALFPQFESLKQGRLAKVFDLFRDYKQAAVDVFVHIKEKPIRVTCQGTILGLSTYAALNNPNFDSYKEQLLDASNKHSIISNLIRNQKSIDSVTMLMKYHAQDRFKRINFGVCSVIMLQPHSTFYDSFDKHCKDTQARWIDMNGWKARILDIGFLNQWYMLNQIMEDYDVNEEDYQN